MNKNNTDKNEVGRTGPSKDEKVSTLKFLKNLADTLNISYHTNIGAEKLQERIDEHLQKQKVKNAVVAKQQAKVEEAKEQQKKLSPEDKERQKRNKIIKDATRLIRISVTCMNPNKKEYDGEVLTVSNSIVPTIKKYVPYNQKPWHVPYMLYQMMKERKCQLFREKKVGDKKIIKGFNIKEYNIEVLDPLTPEELEDLKKEQAMSNRIA